MASGEAIVKKALDQLKSTLTPEDVRMFSNTSLEDLWREARKVEDEQGARLDLRFMRRIEPFLLSLQSYSSVIEVFCQGYAPMAFVWGPIKLMLLLARNYSNVMENILQAFSDIADVLPRLDRLRATFPDDENLNQVVALIYCDIIEFHRRAYKFFRRKAWQFWFAFNWGLFERRFNVILQKLALHCDLLDKEAAAAHFAEMKQLRDKRQLEVDAFEEQRQAQMAQDVFSWLSAEEDQQENRLNRISDERQLETCEWVLKDPPVQPWIEDDCGEAVLWVTGIPGAGKSFLCSLLIENLQTRQDLSTLYYFCSHQSSSANKCAVILQTLAYQLLQQNLDMTPLVHQAYLQKGSTKSGPAMKKLLTQLLPTSKVARIIIDGIDESDHATQQDLLKSLVEIQKSGDHCCKLLVSSRIEPQIPKCLAAKVHLELGEKTAEGLGLYIRNRIRTVQDNFPEMDPALVSLAEQRLRSKANKMFLWVRLVTEMLICQTSELEFETAIDQLPEGLDAAYGVIKSRIDSLRPTQLRQRAFSILYWVCVARRTLSLHEIADGVVLHPDQTSLNRRTRSNNPSKDIIELCAPLLERQKNDLIDLVHFSAKEYFIHEQSGPFVDIAKAHLSIAFSCVTNLTSCFDLVPRRTEGLSEEDLESRVLQGCYGLQSYGQDFWADHVLAYLGEAGDREADAKNLIDALEAFSQVWKHRSHANISFPSTLRTTTASSGLNTLQRYPILRRFISGWLHFKAEFNRTRPSLNTLDAQQQWRLGNDETFLSLIDSRLATITERLLMMQSVQLPPHINEEDYKSFVGRYNFNCRFQGCDYHYGTINERNSHESTHILSFPCLQCDFSGRGFRSRRDLEKHTQKYHMSPEDFEIPDDLNGGRGNFRVSNLASGSFRVSFGQSGHWSERGRKALQQGFHHVLARLESEMKTATGVAGEPDSKDNISANATLPHTNQTTMTVGLDSMRHNVQEQKYESLADFKNDLSQLSRGPTTAFKLAGRRQIESICDDELEKAMSAFPDFANFDHTTFEREITAGFTSNSSEQPQGYVKGLNEQGNFVTSPGAVSFGTRVPYWSLPEQKQFPELLKRYGRDFAKIADHLKTKVPEEVHRQFSDLLSKGKTELADLADLAEARLQQEACSIETATESSDTGLDIRLSHDPTDGVSCDPLQSSQLSNAGLSFSHFGIPNVGLAPIQGTKKRAETNISLGKIMDGPIRKKRRPPLRVQCPHCSKHKDGLRDEWALKKHIERFHTATRRVWICEDNSIDKRFLSKCSLCSERKRYRSKNKAFKHLRKVHFNDGTLPEALQRWMLETEESNLNMGSNGSSGVDDDLDEDGDVDASDIYIPLPESSSIKSDVFYEDISFDYILPGTSSEQRLLNNDGPPHRTNRALIRPDQVFRIPSLDNFRKAACLDQVEALYHKLDNAAEDSVGYKEALEDLISLSKSLKRNWRDWRPHSTFAPHIPLSI